MQENTQAHHREAGQGVTEYALLISSIAIVIIVILNVLTASTRNTFDNLMCNLQPGGMCPSLSEQLQQSNPGNWNGGGGGGSTSTPTPTNTPNPLHTATNTPPPGSTATPTNTSAPTQTPTATATNTPANTATSAPTSTPTTGPTATPTHTPTTAPTSTPTTAPTPTATATPEPPLIIYSNTSLASGWVDWSWNTTRNFNATGNFNSATSSIRVDTNAAWSALYLSSQSALSGSYNTVSFWARGTSSGPNNLQILFYNASGQATTITTITLVSGTWQEYNVSIGAYGLTSLRGIAWQEASNDSSGRFFIDDIQLERN
jgi:Flp pilus assembly pilin Flp